MTTTKARPLSRQAGPAGHPQLGRTIVGGFFLVMGGVHLGLRAQP